MGAVAPVVAFGAKLVGDQRASANAARAAEAAESTARSNRQMIMSEAIRGEDIATKLAKATPQELRAYNTALSTAVSQNARDLKLMDAIDPSLMEASGQILKLLKGEQSSMGGAFESSRAAQRTKLVDSLRSQYGPGAESSAIGQRALRDFDAQSTTSSIGMNTATLGSLSQFLGQRPDATQGFNMLTTAGKNFSAIQDRRIGAQQNATQGILSALTGANQAVQQTAGSGFVYGQLMGRNLAGYGNQALDMMMQGTKAAVAGGGGG